MLVYTHDAHVFFQQGYIFPQAQKYSRPAPIQAPHHSAKSAA